MPQGLRNPFGGDFFPGASSLSFVRATWASTGQIFAATAVRSFLLPTYLVEEGLDVCLEGGAGLHDELLGEHEGVLALRLLRLDDVDEDDVEQLVGDEVGLGDERREDVQHEALHLARVLVAESKRNAYTFAGSRIIIIN